MSGPASSDTISILWRSNLRFEMAVSRARRRCGFRLWKSTADVGRWPRKSSSNLICPCCHHTQGHRTGTSPRRLGLEDPWRTLSGKVLPQRPAHCFLFFSRSDFGIHMRNTWDMSSVKISRTYQIARSHLEGSALSQANLVRRNKQIWSGGTSLNLQLTQKPQSPIEASALNKATKEIIRNFRSRDFCGLVLPLPVGQVFRAQSATMSTHLL